MGAWQSGVGRLEAQLVALKQEFVAIETARAQAEAEDARRAALVALWDAYDKSVAWADAVLAVGAVSNTPYAVLGSQAPRARDGLLELATALGVARRYGGPAGQQVAFVEP